MKKLLILCFCLLLQFYCFSQAKISIKGVILDSEDFSHIPYVSIQIKNTNIGTNANESGFFALSVPDKNEIITLIFSSIGYEIFELQSTFTTTLELKITLKRLETQLPVITISSKKIPIKKIVKKAIYNFEAANKVCNLKLTAFFRHFTISNQDSLPIRNSIITK